MPGAAAAGVIAGKSLGISCSQILDCPSRTAGSQPREAACEGPSHQDMPEGSTVRAEGERASAWSQEQQQARQRRRGMRTARNDQRGSSISVLKFQKSQPLPLA